jgi:hypothetical protein
MSHLLCTYMHTHLSTYVPMYLCTSACLAWSLNQARNDKVGEGQAPLPILAANAFSSSAFEIIVALAKSASFTKERATPMFGRNTYTVHALYNAV